VKQAQGHQQKHLKRGQRKKDRKLALSFFQEGATEKRPKMAKEGRKIAKKDRK